MTLLNKVVEMEYIITVNVNITYTDADKKSVNTSFTTEPIQVDRNDQRTIKMLLDHVVDKCCMPSGLDKITFQAFIYYDKSPSFARIRSADRKLSVQQFIQKFELSSFHPDRSHFILFYKRSCQASSC